MLVPCAQRRAERLAWADELMPLSRDPALARQVARRPAAVRVSRERATAHPDLNPDDVTCQEAEQLEAGVREDSMDLDHLP
eukprot:2260978-Prymnesium_polylepis.2